MSRANVVLIQRNVQLVLNVGAASFANSVVTLEYHRLRSQLRHCAIQSYIHLYFRLKKCSAFLL
jgi:hypothetical protein